MKRVFVFLLCFAICKGYAQQVVTYNFATHQQVEYADGFSELLLENCSYINEEGAPNLPVFGVSILLEPGHEIGSVHVQSIEYYPVVENINIRPAAANFPISKGAPDGYQAVPNPDIYNLNQNYPEHIVGEGYTTFLRGHAIGTFLIYPVLYNPMQKRAEPIKSITLEVYSQATPQAAEALKFLRNDHSTMERVQQATSNRNEAIIHKYNVLCQRDAQPNYDILVITKQSFVGALNNYINHKNLWGYKVLVKTTEEISTAYTGIDAADKMRKCVIDAYTDDGISYLMLFGDSHSSSSSPHNVIPLRKMYVNASGTIDDIPSDVYFACLDGTWYNPSTGKWGDVNFDLGHEISVGRICADNTDEINTFVTKLIKYQETPVVNDIKKALMVGENLDEVPTWGGDCKEQIKTGGTFNGYTTVGLPFGFTTATLYDKNGYWNKSTLINHFKNGVHIVNHLGHSGTDYNMKLGNGDVNNSNFTNTGVDKSLAIVYSQGCYNGAFDNDGWGTDCINEMFHKINGGVVANIGNSRYGWYNPGGTNGPSQRFDRYFFDGLFGQNIYTIGDANTYSKDILSSLVQSNAHLRWCYYELTLQGDPSMDIWTNTPTNFDPQYINIVKHDDTKISVFTTVPYARVAVLQGGQLLSRGVCDEDGEAVLVFDTTIPTSALLSISGHNKYRYEQTGMTFIDAPPVENLQVEIEEVIVSLEWQEPNLSKQHEPPTAYAIYRNGLKIGTVAANKLNYKDVAPAPNTTFEYCVKAVYSGYASAPVCLPATTGLFCRVVTQLKAYVKDKTITLYWAVPEFAPESYSVLRDGVLIKETTENVVVDNVAKENTEYEYCIIAHYDGCDSDPECTTAKSGIVCGAIDVITSTVNLLSIKLSWTHLSPNELMQYVVSRDGVVIAETEEASFTDTVPEENTEYIYCIQARFDKCTSSTKCVTITSGTATGIEQLKIENGELKIYPNPTDGELQVTSYELQVTSIEIFDVMGKKLLTSPPSLTSPETTINIAHLPTGLYFLRITTENGVTVRKVLKQ